MEDEINYYNLARDFGAKRSLGQSFLINREIASMESNYAKGLNVVEMGPGFGILTRELCVKARRVIAIEKDERLFELLGNSIGSSKLRLVHGDFFEIDERELRAVDIMVSNVPYNLSSRVMYWLGGRKIPALLCLQKEFAEHMLARPGTPDYSKLSVVSSLSFSIHHIRDVHAGNFYPKPKVDSSIIYLAPKKGTPDRRSIEVISLIMNHKKKRLKNAIEDSREELGLSREGARELARSLKDADSRPFSMEGGQLLEIAKYIIEFKSSQKE